MATKSTNSKATNTYNQTSAPAQAVPDSAPLSDTAPAPAPVDVSKMNPDVRIHKLYTQGSTRAICSATLFGCIAIHGIHVMQGKKGLFVSMPNRKTQNESYRDIVFPVTKEAREVLYDAVLVAYNQEIQNIVNQAATPQPEAVPDPLPEAGYVPQPAMTM